MEQTKDLSIEETLALINQKIEQAGDDPEEQIRVFESMIVDPQDALNCEGCQ